MILTPSEVLQVSINMGGRIPSEHECKAIIAEVSRVEYLIESFLNFQIDADDYLDGIDDVEMLDTDNYIKDLQLWLPSAML
ncbi:hypothetical protein [Nostoc sp.]|uniref:hypothetical protein n=1 Tax=Nostoc sp. TaxID=1180 RepID=UPI002FF43DE3